MTVPRTVIDGVCMFGLPARTGRVVRLLRVKVVVVRVPEIVAVIGTIVTATTGTNDALWVSADVEAGQ